jgi:F0F1-type ATP synthase assembly protein I
MMHSPRRESPFVIFLRAFPPHVIGIMVAQIALVNGALMIGGVFLGIMLDRQFGTRPLWTLTLPILGAVVSVLVTYRMAMQTVKKSRQAYLRWVESQRAKDAGAVAQSPALATTFNDAQERYTRSIEV